MYAYSDFWYLVADVLSSKYAVDKLCRNNFFLKAILWLV